MALLKCHSGIRGIPNQSCALLYANSSTSDCGCRRAGSFSSTISKGASTVTNAIKRHTTNSQTQTENSNNSNNTTEKQTVKNLKSRLLHLSQLRINVPDKIANVNKFITGTSRKIINARLSNFNNSNSSNKTDVEDESSVYSLEKTITKMNQSVLSFYDPTYVNETVYEARPNVQTTQIVERTEILDDDLANAPRQAPPSTSRSLFPSVPATLEMRRRKAKERRVEKISRLSLESRTKALVQGLLSAFSIMSRISRLEELSEHLIAHPECVWEASNENIVPILQQLASSHDKHLKGMANQCLSLMGFVKPLKSPGIRILSIDGGGTRGLVAIEFLKALEKQTGKKTHELFDYVCGVSTGALVAAIICLYKLSLEECEQLYKRFSIKTFTRNRVVGTTKLVWKYGFYDTEIWEQILRKEMGSAPFIEFSRDPEVPRMAVVSALVTPSRMTNHMFRTYNLPPGMKSQYQGHCKHRIWEVIRASSAAPGYFEPYTLGEDVHEDGGILTNNPTALGIHESRLLWENENLHCVVSLGTGRYETKGVSPAKLSLKRRISTIVDSACDTEAVHHTLQDLLPANTYYRFNPYMSEEFFLDEIRTEKMELMQHDSRLYTRRNNYKLKAVAQKLTERRKPQQVAYDWMKKMAGSVYR